MPEAPFGSVASIWPTVPVPGFGYFQMPIASVQRPMSTVPLPTPQGPVAFSNGPPTSVPAFANTETFGITAPALLGAVAVRRGQPFGPTNDQEIEDFIYDALELFSGTNDVDVRCEGGRVTLSGVVQHKRLKRDTGEIAWAIPGVTDVQNNVTIAPRRRSRAGREAEPSTVGARKQA
jgi:hypothetical protein